eukprot:TRINITY_DN10913_c0_g1_i2.p1 TRINITY_DN10913_c0_g1~~TRINITY_DN10913_c0_g1_i2.p1  ORF type:complete len:514 (-),score=58.70 TRINITY_DN10913_c0_g1_i2:60-1601(-)
MVSSEGVISKHRDSLRAVAIRTVLYSAATATLLTFSLAAWHYQRAPYLPVPAAASYGPLRLTATSARRLSVGDYNDCRRPHQAGKPMPPAWSGEDDKFFDDFRRLEDISRYVRRLRDLRPDLVTIREIGRSWEGRPLELLEITERGVSSSAPEDKPCIFLESGIHAREWIAPSTVLYIADTLVRRAEDATVQPLLRTFLFSLLVVVNPDGYVYTWTTDRMWRKNRADRPETRCGGAVAGVDLNRNWGFSWGRTTDQAYKARLHSPCTEVFIGPGAFSEPETRAPAEYMRERQMRSLRASKEGRPGPGYVAAFLDFHSYAQFLLPPWGYTAETPEGTDGQYQTALTKSMVDAYRRSSGRTFKAAANLFPPDPGTGPDWAYGELGIRATMTVELEGTRLDMDGFCEPKSMIRSVGAEQWAGLLAVMAHLEAQGSEPSTAMGAFAASREVDDEPRPYMSSQYLLTAVGLLCGGAACFLLACWLRRRIVGMSQRQAYGEDLELNDGPAPEYVGGGVE